MRLKIDWASLIVGKKFTVCALYLRAISKYKPPGKANDTNLSSRVFSNTVKFQKISPGAYIFQGPFLRGLSTEGNLRLKIDWASLIVGKKFTVCALYLRAISKYKPPGGLIFGGTI